MTGPVIDRRRRAGYTRGSSVPGAPRSPIMADPSKVVTNTGSVADATEAHHRDFPDIRAEGETPAQAGTNLIMRLTKALETAESDPQRGPIDRAIADVRAWTEQAPS